jgi:hypothetical protein
MEFERALRVPPLIEKAAAHPELEGKIFYVCSMSAAPSCTRACS